jgi:hypothetical protein
MAYEINLCCNLVTDKTTKISAICSQKICSIAYITILLLLLLPFFFFFNCDRLGPVAFSALELTASLQAIDRKCDRPFATSLRAREYKATRIYMGASKGIRTRDRSFRAFLNCDIHMAKPEYLPR